MRPPLLQHPRGSLNKLQHKRTAQRESGTQKPLITIYEVRRGWVAIH